MSDLVGEIDIILHENKQLREQNRVLREALRQALDDRNRARDWLKSLRMYRAAKPKATSQEGQHGSR